MCGGPLCIGRANWLEKTAQSPDVSRNDCSLSFLWKRLKKPCAACTAPSPSKWQARRNICNGLPSEAGFKTKLLTYHRLRSWGLRKHTTKVCTYAQCKPKTSKHCRASCSVHLIRKLLIESESCTWTKQQMHPRWNLQERFCPMEPKEIRTDPWGICDIELCNTVCGKNFRPLAPTWQILGRSVCCHVCYVGAIFVAGSVWQSSLFFHPGYSYIVQRRTLHKNGMATARVQ